MIDSSSAVDGPGCEAGTDDEGNGREEDNLAKGVSSSDSNSELGRLVPSKSSPSKFSQVVVLGSSTMSSSSTSEPSSPA